jgi:hypothetical protein
MKIWNKTKLALPAAVKCLKVLATAVEAGSYFHYYINIL